MVVTFVHVGALKRTLVTLPNVSDVFVVERPSEEPSVKVSIPALQLQLTEDNESQAVEETVSDVDVAAYGQRIAAPEEMEIASRV